jgi:hypothetical protein
MNTGEIKKFVQKTLGCGCPEEVFRQIDYQADIMAGNILLSARINIGNRLLVYVAEVDNTETIENLLPQLIDIGKKERDAFGFNRFRLVLAVDGIEEMERIATDLFGKINKDEKVHLHAVSKENMPDFSNT